MPKSLQCLLTLCILWMSSAKFPLSWEKGIYLLSFYLLIMTDKLLTSHLSAVLQPYTAVLHGYGVKIKTQSFKMVILSFLQQMKI